MFRKLARVAKLVWQHRDKLDYIIEMIKTIKKPK